MFYRMMYVCMYLVTYIYYTMLLYISATIYYCISVLLYTTVYQCYYILLYISATIYYCISVQFFTQRYVHIRSVYPPTVHGSHTYLVHLFMPPVNSIRVGVVQHATFPVPPVNDCFSSNNVPTTSRKRETSDTTKVVVGQHGDALSTICFRNL